MQLKKIILPLLLIAVAFQLQAFNFEPISQDFTPYGRGANRVFRVVNTGNDKIAVSVSIHPRSIEYDGTEVQGEETDKFIIYPRQMILEAGESRSIRVKWTGEQELSEEQTFRIIAEQVPVAFTESTPVDGGRIELTYRYEGNVYIVPDTAVDDIVVDSVKRVTRDERTLLAVELTNLGTRHSLLREAELTLKRDENDPSPLKLTDEKMQGLTGENMLAGIQRVFYIPVPDGLWDGPLYGTIKYKPTY